VSNALSRSWRRYNSLPTVQRELVTLAVMLVVALTILPLAIWLAGQVFLGDYLRDPAGSRVGGPGALIGDFVRHDEPHPTEGDVGTPWFSLDYVYPMQVGDAVLPRPPIK
jgi:hypothetical protein